jgi:hypothetical protein
MIKSPIDGKLKHIETQITYSYSFEQEAPDFDYGSKEENEKEMARFNSGELSNVFLKVYASALGETGSDSLGQVFVVSNKMEKQLIETAVEHDMKNNACAELRENILCQWRTMSAAFSA